MDDNAWFILQIIEICIESVRFSRGTEYFPEAGYLVQSDVLYTIPYFFRNFVSLSTVNNL